MSSAAAPGSQHPGRDAAALRALLEGLIDYAGLFPPAGLEMTAAVRNFAAYQRRPDAWALGRFVVPVARLPEFESALGSLTEAERLGTRWPLTALLGQESTQEIGRVLEFNERHVHGGPQVLSLEARTLNVDQVQRVVRGAGPAIEAYCELPLGDDLAPLVAAVRETGGLAKIRTGGIQASDFPSPELVLGFLRATAAARVPFKATAGLHHPVRGPAPLTYVAGSASATMFGYLNLVLAATVLWHGRPESEARRLLVAEARTTLELSAPGAIRWEGIEIGIEEIRRARRQYAKAIGSCSFTEPLDEIDS